VLKIDTVIRKIIENKENWHAFSFFCSSVLRRKEAAERERERGGIQLASSDSASIFKDSDDES
jgi:hypothetical protein